MEKFCEGQHHDENKFRRNRSLYIVGKIDCSLAIFNAKQEIAPKNGQIDFEQYQTSGVKVIFFVLYCCLFSFFFCFCLSSADVFFLSFSFKHRKHFVEWSRIVGHLAYTGNRRALLLGSIRRWSNSVACLKAARWSQRRHMLRKASWTQEAVAPYQEKIRRLEFQLAQVNQSKQSDSKEKQMLHAYLSHSAQRNVFALDVIDQLRRKLT